MTKEEIRGLSNEALVDVFGFAYEQKSLREVIAETDDTWKAKVKEIEEEIELLREELNRRLKRSCLGL